jgi:hypothetical protein
MLVDIVSLLTVAARRRSPSSAGGRSSRVGRLLPTGPHFESCGLQRSCGHAFCQRCSLCS